MSYGGGCAVRVDHTSQGAEIKGARGTPQSHQLSANRNGAGDPASSRCSTCCVQFRVLGAERAGICTHSKLGHQTGTWNTRMNCNLRLKIGLRVVGHKAGVFVFVDGADGGVHVDGNGFILVAVGRDCGGRLGVGVRGEMVSKVAETRVVARHRQAVAVVATKATPAVAVVEVHRPSPAAPNRLGLGDQLAQP